MGTFGTYTGPMEIEEERRGEFIRQMERLLHYGGMMTMEDVKIYGRLIHLLKPAEMNDESDILFYYNYFEDTSWECGRFQADECDLYTGKIGWQEFQEVAMAGYVLCELHDSQLGFAEINGSILTDEGSVGWINHLMGTEFDMSRHFRLWEIAENIALKKLDYGYDECDIDIRITDILPPRAAYMSGGVELADVLYVSNGTETLTPEEVRLETYAADVLACKKALENYFNIYRESGSQAACEEGVRYAEGENLMQAEENRRSKEEKLSNAEKKLWELLRMDRAGREECTDSELADIARHTLILPARVIIYLSMEMLRKPFWKFWLDIREEVYHDEKMKSYALPDLEKARLNRRKKPIPPVRTGAFLRCADRDRLYWWDGTDEVRISEETDEWLKKLAEEYKEIKKHLAEEKEYSFFEKFLTLLNELDVHYGHIFPFRTMFYEFLKNGYREEYRAAVELLKNLAERNWEEGKVIETSRESWSMKGRSVTHNPGRMELKRYLAVMANQKLREKYFGF